MLGVSVGKSSSFQVGKVNFLSLYPMNFFEYLEAAGEELLLEQLIRKEDCNPLPQLLHNKLIALYKFFLFLGGMPEVVSHYLEHQDVQAARNIQREILGVYERDFSKYTTASGAIRVSEIWRAAPALLARE
ncbi:MAG: ATPase, partial [Candidatus Eisenbacteria sp.]|nr:ATPase [Candidatus Eisenbacteria bacterium]